MISFVSEVYDYVATTSTSTDVAKMRYVQDKTIAKEEDQPTEIRTQTEVRVCSVHG